MTLSINTNLPLNLFIWMKVIEKKINNLNLRLKETLKITHSLRETTSNQIKFSKNKIYLYRHSILIHDVLEYETHCYSYYIWITKNKSQGRGANLWWQSPHYSLSIIMNAPEIPVSHATWLRNHCEFCECRTQV